MLLVTAQMLRNYKMAKVESWREVQFCTRILPVCLYIDFLMDLLSTYSDEKYAHIVLLLQ